MISVGRGARSGGGPAERGLRRRCDAGGGEFLSFGELVAAFVAEKRRVLRASADALVKQAGRI